MQNYKNIYLEESKLGKENSWEYYFQQPTKYTLKDIKPSDKVKLSKLWQNIPFPDPKDMALFNNIDELKMWQDYAKKHIKLQPHIKEKINQEYHELIKKDDKVLGILARGTDYTSTKPTLHPIQPNPDTIIKKIKEKLERKEYNKIFLASEDKNIVKRFKNEFGDKLIMNKQSLKNYDGESHIGNIQHDRKNDKYLNGLEYLTTIIILSKCNAIIAGRTNGSLAALILNNNAYEYQYFFNLGLFPESLKNKLKGWKRGLCRRLKSLLKLDIQ